MPNAAITAKSANKRPFAEADNFIRNISESANLIFFCFICRYLFFLKNIHNHPLSRYLLVNKFVIDDFITDTILILNFAEIFS